MKVVASNCGCCAIKHIRDFKTYPSDITYSNGKGHDEDQSTSAPTAYTNWAEYSSPFKASAGEIFRALVAEIIDRRPAGMITCNLVSTLQVDECREDCCGFCEGCGDEEEFDETQVNAWRPIMEELGFTEAVFRNSNSGNRIHHFTLIYDEWDGD